MSTPFFRLPVSSAKATVQLDEADITMLSEETYTLWSFANKSLSSYKGGRSLTPSSASSYSFSDNQLIFTTAPSGAIVTNIVNPNVITIAGVFTLKTLQASSIGAFFGDYYNGPASSTKMGFASYLSSTGEITLRESTTANTNVGVTLTSTSATYIALSIDRVNLKCEWLISQAGVKTTGIYTMATHLDSNKGIALGSHLLDGGTATIGCYEMFIDEEAKTATQLDEIYLEAKARMSKISVVI
jgi:hypothetical protein